MPGRYGPGGFNTRVWLTLRRSQPAKICIFSVNQALARAFLHDSEEDVKPDQDEDAASGELGAAPETGADAPSAEDADDH